MNYVTYDASGNLTGAYQQDLLPEHAANYIEVPAEQRRDWVKYRANPARTGLELAPVLVDTDAIWERIKAERDRRKAAGTKVGTKWFHSDDGSRIQQLGLVLLGANVPAELLWKTMDGTFVPMTQTLAAQIFQATAASDQAIFARAEQHKAAMEASANPALYNFLTGWPLSYGE